MPLVPFPCSGSKTKFSDCQDEGAGARPPMSAEERAEYDQRRLVEKCAHIPRPLRGKGKSPYVGVSCRKSRTTSWRANISVSA